MKRRSFLGRVAGLLGLAAVVPAKPNPASDCYTFYPRESGKWTVIASENFPEFNRVAFDPYSGYSSAPTVAITRGGGTGASAVVVMSGNSVTGIQLV